MEDDIECRPFSLSHAYWLCRLEADPCSLCAACCAAARLLSSDFWRGRAPSPGARPPPPPPPTQLLRVSRPPVSRRVAENNSFSTIRLNQLDTILSRSYNIRTSTSMFGVKETVRNDFHLAFIYSFVQTREVFSFSLLILQRFPQTVSLSIYLSIKFF